MRCICLSGICIKTRPDTATSHTWKLPLGSTVTSTAPRMPMLLMIPNLREIVHRVSHRLPSPALIEYHSSAHVEAPPLACAFHLLSSPVWLNVQLEAGIETQCSARANT